MGICGVGICGRRSRRRCFDTDRILTGTAGRNRTGQPEDENPTEPEEKEPVAAVQEEYSETPVPDEPAEASREEGSDDPDNGHQED